MCGIAGILDLRGRPVERPLLERLCARLAHRGPDDQGIHIDGEAGLGQRRLSIIDLPGGRQPLANEDGTVWVTFNGEIYNFDELRRDLIARGHRFATRSDTEVIVHAYEQFGPDCVTRFRGMFALAVWDVPRRRLFLARDRVGKKPLFYAEAGGQFVFASELQALLEHPCVRREPDPRAIDDYLTYGYVPAPRTAFAGVLKLPPAHWLTVSAPTDGLGPARTELAPYWRLEYGPKHALDDAEACAALREVLTDAVRVRMVADVPLGALLSGGVDSSLVVALLSRLSDRPVKTFSIGFDEKQFNELPYARLVARHYGTEHHELIVRPHALDVLPTLVRHYGEPFADASAVPTYYVAQLTRQHVTVALNGDGGDESFAGYERYWAAGQAERYQRLPPALRRRVVEPLAALVPDSLPRRSRLGRGKRFLQAAAQPAAPRYLRWVTYFSPQQKAELLTPEFLAALAGHDATRWLLAELAAPDDARAEGLDALLAADVRSYLPNDLLVKMDVATMACSLEARSPLLDQHVMEFAARLPAHAKIRGSVLKYALKRVARDLLPRPVLTRRKMGFGIPVGEWLRGELRPLLDDVLLAPGARLGAWVRPDAVRALVSAHVARHSDHTDRVWALLCLELWAREFLR